MEIVYEHTVLFGLKISFEILYDVAYYVHGNSDSHIKFYTFSSIECHT